MPDDQPRLIFRLGAVTVKIGGRRALVMSEDAACRALLAHPELMASCKQLLEEYVEDALGGEYTGCGCTADGPENLCGMCRTRAAIAQGESK